MLLDLFHTDHQCFLGLLFIFLEFAQITIAGNAQHLTQGHYNLIIADFLGISHHQAKLHSPHRLYNHRGSLAEVFVIWIKVVYFTCVFKPDPYHSIFLHSYTSHILSNRLSKTSRELQRARKRRRASKHSSSKIMVLSLGQRPIQASMLSLSSLLTGT